MAAMKIGFPPAPSSGICPELEAQFGAPWDHGASHVLLKVWRFSATQNLISSHVTDCNNEFGDVVASVGDCVCLIIWQSCIISLTFVIM